MDHLPRPQSPYTDYPVIKCLCADAPTQADFRVKSLNAFEFHKEDFLPKPSCTPSFPEVAPFLQAWLWFGTLQRIFSILGIVFNPEDFLVDDSSVGLRVSSRALNKYFWYWVAVESQADEADEFQHMELINQCLNEVFEVVTLFTIDDADSKGLGIRDVEKLGSYVDDLQVNRDESNVLLSIIVLAEALDDAQKKIYLNTDTGRTWRETLTIRTRLIQAGWCLHELYRLTHQFNVCHATSMLYLSCIDRRGFRKNHSNCSVRSCVHDAIDYATYRPVHVSSGCTCPTIGLRYDQYRLMDTVLHQGGIPLLIFRSDGVNGEGRLQIIRHSVGQHYSRYVALSHVWSDGMGNLRDNALPECQLKRIQQCASACSACDEEEAPFWIDTICVPRETSARSLAIRNMRSVYEQAEKVLVLDSTLQTLDSSTTAVELMLRIKIAPWSTRLWTYHEGALAKSIMFQLGDCARGGLDWEEGDHLEIYAGMDLTSMHELLEDGFNTDLRDTLIRAQSICMADNESWDAVCRATPSLENILKSPPSPTDIDLASEIRRLTTQSFQDRAVQPVAPFNALYIEAIISYHELRGTYERVFTKPLPAPLQTPTWQQISEVITAIAWRTTSWQGDEPVCIATILGLDVGKIQEAPVHDRMKVLGSMWQSVPSAIAFYRSSGLQAEGFCWMPRTFLGAALQVPYFRDSGREEGLRTPRGLMVGGYGMIFSLTVLQHAHEEVRFLQHGSCTYCLSVDSQTQQRTWEDAGLGAFAVLPERHLKNGVDGRGIGGLVVQILEEQDSVKYVKRLFCVTIFVVKGLDHAVHVAKAEMVGFTHQWCID